MAGPKGINIPTSASPGRGARAGAMPPTATTLIILVGLEILAYCGMRYLFRTAHGG